MGVLWAGRHGHPGSSGRSRSWPERSPASSTASSSRSSACRPWPSRSARSRCSAACALGLLGTTAMADFPGGADRPAHGAESAGPGIPDDHDRRSSCSSSSVCCCTSRPSAEGSTRSGSARRRRSFVGINVARTKFWLYVIRRRVGPRRHLLDAALLERPRRQRHRPGTARHRGRAARRGVDLRRRGLASTASSPASC